MEAGTVPSLCVRETDFTPEEVVEILDNSNDKEKTSIIRSKITSVPPCHPKAGEVYLFKPDSSRNASKLIVKCCTWLCMLCIFIIRHIL